MADGDWLSPSSGAVFLPPEMILQMALGMEPMQEIAARFGYDEANYLLLFQQPWFQQKVDAKRTELRESGITLQAKARIMAEDLMTETYIRAKNPKAGLEAVLAATKFMAEIADIKPKGDHGQGDGGFTVIINTGGGQVAVSPGKANLPPGRDTEIIDVTPTVVVPFDAVTLGPPPAFANTGATNRDLVGELSLDDIDALLPEPDNG